MWMNPQNVNGSREDLLKLPIENEESDLGKRNLTQLRKEYIKKKKTLCS